MCVQVLIHASTHDGNIRSRQCIIYTESRPKRPNQRRTDRSRAHAVLTLHNSCSLVVLSMVSFSNTNVWRQGKNIFASGMRCNIHVDDTSVEFCVQWRAYQQRFVPIVHIG